MLEQLVLLAALGDKVRPVELGQLVVLDSLDRKGLQETLGRWEWPAHVVWMALRVSAARLGCLAVREQLVLLDSLVPLDSLDKQVRLVSLASPVHRDQKASKVSQDFGDFRVIVVLMYYIHCIVYISS